MKKNRFLYLPLPIVTLILEILPYGAVCNFANPEGDPWRVTYSYFSLTPFGYANFWPFLTALLSCVLLIWMTVSCVTEKTDVAIKAKPLLWAAVVLSLCPLLFGIRNFSLVGGLITASLAGELTLIHFIGKSTNTI